MTKTESRSLRPKLPISGYGGFGLGKRVQETLGRAVSSPTWSGADPRSSEDRHMLRSADAARLLVLAILYKLI